jgi:hypothetical protein
LEWLTDHLVGWAAAMPQSSSETTQNSYFFHKHRWAFGESGMLEILYGRRLVERYLQPAISPVQHATAQPTNAMFSYVFLPTDQPGNHRASTPDLAPGVLLWWQLPHPPPPQLLPSLAFLGQPSASRTSPLLSADYLFF